MSRVNILLTSVGRRVELVRAFRAAYDRLKMEGNIVATDIDRLAPALQEVDVAIMVPRTNDAGFVPVIARICGRESIDAVFPLTDHDIPVLAYERAKIEAAGARLAVVDSAAAAICGDKLLTNDFFNGVGLTTPRSWLPGQIALDAVRYPVFVKPRDGSAAKHAYKVRNAKELAFFQDYVPNAIVQQYLKGAEITSDVICDLDGRVLSVVCRKRIAVRGGEVIKAVTIRDESIAAACRQVARFLPAVGPITVQCIMHQGRPYYIEINARLGGGIPLAIAAGVDVPALLLSSIAGQFDASQAVNQYKEGLYMTRCDESIFVTDDECRATTSDYL